MVFTPRRPSETEHTRPTESFEWDKTILGSQTVIPGDTVKTYSALFHHEFHKRARKNKRNGELPVKLSRSILKKCDYNVILQTPAYLHNLAVRDAAIQENLQRLNDETIARHTFEITGHW